MLPFMQTILYASTSVRTPGPFAAPAAVVRSNGVGYQRFRRLTVPVNQGSNVRVYTSSSYLTVTCNASECMYAHILAPKLTTYVSM